MVLGRQVLSRYRAFLVSGGFGGLWENLTGIDVDRLDSPFSGDLLWDINLVSSDDIAFLLHGVSIYCASLIEPFITPKILAMR